MRIAAPCAGLSGRDEGLPRFLIGIIEIKGSQLHFRMRHFADHFIDNKLAHAQHTSVKAMSFLLFAVLVISIQGLAQEKTEATSKVIEAEFQRATVNWLTRDISWLNSWQFRQLSKLPTGFDVMFMIINQYPRNGSIAFSTYAILKPSHLLNQKTEEFLAVYINDTEYSTDIKSKTVGSDFVMSIFDEVWNWEMNAGIETQGIRLGTDENKVSYVLAGRPHSKLQRTEGLLMLEAINPSKGGLLDSMQSKLQKAIFVAKARVEHDNSGK